MNKFKMHNRMNTILAKFIKKMSVILNLLQSNIAQETDIELFNSF